MTEADRSAEGKKSKEQALFDDRVDIQPHISNLEVIYLSGRSLRYLLGDFVGVLFSAKWLLGIIGYLPALALPWIGKMIVDQVIVQKPFDEVEVPYPWFVQPFIDAVAHLGPLELMGVLCLLLLAMLFIFGRSGLYPNLEAGYDSATESETKISAGGSSMGGLIGLIEALVDIRLNQRIANRFRTQLFGRLTRLPMKTIDDHRIGDSVYRVMYDAPDLPNLCMSLTLTPFFLLLGIAITFYQMETVYGGVAPELIWVAASALPLSIAVTVPLSGFVRRIQQRSRAAGAATTNAIEEGMSNLHAVQSLGGMDVETDRVEKKSAESFRRFRHIVLTGIGISSIEYSISGLLTIFVVVFVTNQVIAGTMSPGDYVVLTGLALAIAGSGLSVGMYWIGLQDQVAAVRRVFFFIDFETEERLDHLDRLPPVESSIRFENVSLTYPNGQPALRSIDLELQVGQLVAIVGPTGAGKTSLAYLLPRYYEPTGGRIFVDNHELSTLNVDSVRSQISYVFQEHLLLNESVRSNLLLVKRDATDRDIVNACEAAGAMEFIGELPDGLDTVLGQSGDTLSVGQKQRLCIARGLIRDTRILILDEPTAALDPKSENALVRSLRDASADRLVIVIAHRLSTIRRADRIVFMEDGEIRDVGSHDELMEVPNGNYRRFVELQAGASAA